MFLRNEFPRTFFLYPPTQARIRAPLPGPNALEQPYPEPQRISCFYLLQQLAQLEQEEESQGYGSRGPLLPRNWRPTCLNPFQEYERRRQQAWTTSLELMQTKDIEIVRTQKSSFSILHVYTKLMIKSHRSVLHLYRGKVQFIFSKTCPCTTFP